MRNAEEANLSHSWYTGQMCRCMQCYCCGVYRSLPTAPKSYADNEVDDKRVREQRSASALSAYMYARLNNR